MRPQSAARPRLTATPTRQYTLKTASGCVYGNDNINGGPNDDFLDDTYLGSNGTVPDLTQFTSGTSSGGASGGAATAGNLTFERERDRSLTSAVSGTTYAIGIEDGGTPKWAVFFVTATTDGTLSGTWSIQKCEGPCANPDSDSYGVLTTDRTALSHIVLYTGGAGTGGGGTGGGGTGGGGTGGGGTPEPAVSCSRPWTAGRRLSFPARRMR